MSGTEAGQGAFSGIVCAQDAGGPEWPSGPREEAQKTMTRKLVVPSLSHPSASL